jgi:CHAT domain-containing protein/tetratricopeptide (TPR) repeat protein
MPKSLSASILIVALFFVANCSAQNNDYSDLKARYDNAIESNSQDSAYYLATQMKEWAFRNESDTSFKYGVSQRLIGEYFMSIQVMDSAKYYLSFSVDFFSKKNGFCRIEYLNSLNKLANLFSLMGDYTQAEGYLIKALEIATELFGKNSNEYASVLLAFGKIKHRQSFYGEAFSIYNETLQVFINLENQNEIDLARTYNCIGVYYSDLGNLDLSMEFYQKAEVLMFKCLGENNVEYAGVLNNIAGIYIDKGDYKSSELYYLKAVEIKIKNLGENNSDVAMTMRNLAMLYQIMGEDKLAEFYFKRCSEITAKTIGVNSLQYANDLVGLGGFYYLIADYKSAEFYYLESLRIFKNTSGVWNRDYVVAAINMADLYLKMADYKTAESVYLECTDIVTKIIGHDHELYADCVFGLGNLYCTLGNNIAAIDCYNSVLEVYENLSGNHNLDIARVTGNIALCYINLGELKNAEIQLSKALLLCESDGNETTYEYASILSFLAITNQFKGDYEQAELNYLKSIEITKEDLGDNSAAEAMHNLGSLYEEMGEIGKAELSYLEALEIQKKTFGDFHPYTIQMENSLAYLFAKKNLQLQAYIILSKNLELKTRQISLNFEWLNEGQKEAYWSSESDFFNRISWFTNISYSKVPESIALNYNSSLLAKGKMLENKITSENFYREVDEMREELAYRRRLLAKMESDGSTESIRMNKLRKEADSLDKKLTLSWPEYAQQKKNLTITWQQVQQNLEKGEAAIEFVRFYNEDDSLYYYNALVVKKGDSNPTLVRLCMEKELETITPKNGYLEYFPLIWQPLEGALEGITTVYYSPVGLLNNIAFSAISISGSAEGENRYLLDRYNLHQLISTRYLAMGLKQKQFVKTEVSIALFGGLEYDFLPGIKNKKSGLSGRQNNMRGGEVSSYKVPFLQGTKDEVDQIASTFKSHVGNVQKFEGVNGTEEAFMQLENKASFTVLHVATHGFALPVFDFKDSTISKNSLRYSYRYSTNPMVRSGLIMSGGYWAWNGSDTLIKLGASQNGILTALEISQLNLRKTKLVVLSACETGLGKIDNSEGTFGLKRSFKLAGVEQLIVSLWSVPDKETKELMKLFYSDFAISLNPAESFNKAQKQMRNKYPDEPEKWAAFVLIR